MDYRPKWYEDTVTDERAGAPRETDDRAEQMLATALVASSLAAVIALFAAAYIALN